MSTNLLLEDLAKRHGGKPDGDSTSPPSSTSQSGLADQAPSSVTPDSRVPSAAAMDGEQDTPPLSPAEDARNVERNVPPSLLPSSKGWRSWKIGRIWMATVMATEVALIAIIVYLERYSAGHDGIRSVPQIDLYANSHSAVADVWRYGLLWTVVPSTVVSLFGSIMWATVLSGTADRQPFVELRRRDKSASAAITIMLDYRSYPAFYNWFVAWFRKKHFLIGCAMFLNFVFTTAIVPLAAHLLVALPSQSASSTSLTRLTAFNDSAFTARVNLQPAIDLANSVRTYGASPPTWMLADYAFEAFGADDALTSGNLTATTSAYSGVLDCQPQAASDTLQYSNGQVTAKIIDRGCEVASSTFPVSGKTAFYAHSWNSQCSGSAYGRFAMVAASYSDSSPNKLANISVVSCKPLYKNTTGALTVALHSNASPSILDFAYAPSDVVLFHDYTYQTFEDTLMTYRIIDPTNTFLANAFGFAVYSSAKVKNSQSPLQDVLIQQSMEEIFSTLYASLVNTVFLPPPPAPPRPAQGTLTVRVTRLYVVPSAAYAIVAVLAAMLLSTLSLLIYAETHDSILREEPVGLLGQAAVLEQSDVVNVVAAFRKEHPDVHGMTDYIKAKYTVAESRCYWDEVDGKIAVDGLVERIPPPRTWAEFFTFKKPPKA